MTGGQESKAFATSGLQRIAQRPDYVRVAGSGRRWVTPSFILQARRVADDRTTRVGFTVSKKVGNAVKRSRARRRLKEAARLTLPKVAPQGWDLVLVGRTAALDYDFAKICSDLRWALGKLEANADLKSSGRAKPKHKSRN